MEGVRNDYKGVQKNFAKQCLIVFFVLALATDCLRRVIVWPLIVMEYKYWLALAPDFQRAPVNPLAPTIVPLLSTTLISFLLCC